MRESAHAVLTLAGDSLLLVQIDDVMDGDRLRKPLEIRLIYQDFDDYWSSQTAEAIRHISDADADGLKALLVETLPTDGNGQISYSARVNAVRGRLP